MKPRQQRRLSTAAATWKCEGGGGGGGGGALAPSPASSRKVFAGTARGASSMATVDNDDDGAFGEDGDRAPAAVAPGAESEAGGGDGGAARYAEGPSTRMNLFTAVNSALRTAMETDETAVRRVPGLFTISRGVTSLQEVETASVVQR